MVVSYTGNGHYCYTNSLYMTLEGYGAEALPGTYFIECLTTMPFGHFYLAREKDPLVFFSGANIDPDRGLSLAIETLGWEAEEAFGLSPHEALENLREALQTGPVLAGPVDAGYLTYHPNHRNLSGSDHFVVVLDIVEKQVILHDPAGFPFAPLPMEDFLSAWKADQVVYKRGPYTFRYRFRPVRKTSHQEMIRQTLERIAVNLTFNPDGPVVYGGVKALRLFSEELKKPLSPQLEAHLLWFAFPLAARRALDAARFFKDADRPACAEILVEKAKLFGQANGCAARKEWQEVRRILNALIDLEERLISALK
ncbi:BtrH N-terminal domain-containing protein [Caenibacillus caldisaponilyticus]|uniref:BtrH N-terminal domain-containing protein n=1 Tax=Caenibacillus caldisaponilyticus TaxID=1674942 RepID=UPI00098846F6|nr:BtrH N-terminal domain-containing protein [Caenibacillus caldisaponilyticus]